MATPQRAPCEGQPIYTNPTRHTPQQVKHAQNACQACPLLITCANQALTSGTTLDGQHRAPASDVIQAGVWCKGDKTTSAQLHTILGTTPGRRTPTRKQAPPPNCVECGQPMTIRIKTVPVTPGVMTHAAHGRCRVCDARRRRQPGWQSTTPKHSTILEWRTPNARNHPHHLDGDHHGPDTGPVRRHA